MTELFLIDDDEITNYFNNDLISDLNYFDEIKVFTDAKLALHELTTRYENGKKLPGYIIVDIKMPEIDGFEFIDQLDYLLKDVEENQIPKLAILTSSNHKRDVEEYEKTPIVKVMLQKPLDDDKLKQFIG